MAVRFPSVDDQGALLGATRAWVEKLIAEGAPGDTSVTSRLGSLETEFSDLKPLNGARAVGRGETAVLPEDYGAKADGSTDDAPALIAALKAAKGKTVLLRSGAVYRLDTPLEVSGVDVRLRTSGADRAVLLHNGQALNPIVVRAGATTVSTTLKASIGINTAQWQVSSVSGVKPGQIMSVVSSVAWYHDDRGAAKKSELHLVDRVEDGSVYTRDPAFDAYTVSSEQVAIAFVDPIKVDIDNVTLRMVRPAPGDNVPEKIGIIVENAVEPRITRVRTECALGAGISVRHSYKPVVEDPVSIDSCGYYTGYGVQVYGCTHAKIVRPYAAGCRRGVDVSGEVIVSRRTRIYHGVNVGGGKDSRGVPYGFTTGNQWGTSPQYGYGTHGPADDTAWVGCTTVEMHHHYLLRGRNEKILDARMAGRAFKGYIVCSYGTNLIVTGCEAVTGYEGAGTTGVNPGAPTVDNTVGEGFIYFAETYQAQKGMLKVENNLSVATRCFIRFATATAAPLWFTARNNEVVFHGSPTGALIQVESGSADAKYWYLNGNVQRFRLGGYQAQPITSGAVPELTKW